MKMMDYTQNPPMEIMAYSLSEIAREVCKMKERTDQYFMRTSLEKIHVSTTVSSPQPDYMVDSIPYWKTDKVQAWADAFDKSLESERQERAKKLAQHTVSKQEIVEALLNRAKWVAARNAAAYPNNRNNSISDAKRRFHELEGSIFLAQILLDIGKTAKMTDEDTAKLNTFLQSARKNARIDT